MEEHKEELATIESIDSGAVYTLALKTHVGMSIDTWRYFAGISSVRYLCQYCFNEISKLGWCDKIHGSTIPVNNARPNRNLTFTKREPIGFVTYFRLHQSMLQNGNYSSFIFNRVCGLVTPWK